VNRVTYIAWVVLFAASAPLLRASEPRFAATSFPGGCHIAPIAFRGWHAEQLANSWVTLTIVPQLGGRLVQIVFGGHAYLFINPHYEGKYIPPAEVPERQWINYGGDKIWPMPEGNEDENHWPGPISDNLDDSSYSLTITSQGSTCAVTLEGPADPRTGLQYSRGISIDADSPAIHFHAVMKNAFTRPIRWSMQSVSQYDTADSDNSTTFNHDFWAFTPANPHSVYPGGYHVRTGSPDDPSFSVASDLFTLHWLDLQSEVWIDSPGDWVAALDAATGYGMIERFSYTKSAEYPGGASVIFYKNGAAPKPKEKQNAAVTPDPDDSLFYMEAELNSPVVTLLPGDSYAMDTRWFPVRLGSPRKADASTRPEITVTSAALVAQPLEASLTDGGLVLSGSFSVFYSGNLVAYLYDQGGGQAGTDSVQPVNPSAAVTLHHKIKARRDIVRVSLHLVDSHGSNRGTIGETRVAPLQGGH
jgi:hypothetical protein